MKAYKLTVRTYQVHENQTIHPDGFAGFEVHNSGYSALTINGGIAVASGSGYRLHLEPYVQLDSDVELVFANPEEATATVVLFYYTQL